MFTLRCAQFSITTILWPSKNAFFFSCSSTLQCRWPQSSRSKSQLQPHIAATTLGWNYCTIWSGGPEFCSSYSQAYSVVGSVDWGITCTWFHAFHTRISLTTIFYIMLRVLSTCIEWKLPLNLQHNILSTVLKKNNVLHFKILQQWPPAAKQNKHSWKNWLISQNLLLLGLWQHSEQRSMTLLLNLYQLVYCDKWWLGPKWH